MKNLILILIVVPSFLFSQGWEKTYQYGTGYSVQQTTDGGYIVIGTGAITTSSIYMIKTDNHGDTLWTKHYNLNSRELFCSGIQTSDGGYIITGLTTKPAPDLDNVFLLKTDSNGDSLWSNDYGGNKDDAGFSVQQTTDGGYVVTGRTKSFGNSHDVYLIKTDSLGVEIWSKTYGDDYDNSGRSVIQTSDNGFFLTTNTYILGSGFSWIDLIKTDSVGNIEWTSTFDNEDDDVGFSAQSTDDGGFIIAGMSEEDNNIGDVLLFKTSDNGSIEWSRTYGDRERLERGNCVTQTAEGGYLVVGAKKTDNTDFDIFLVKTDSFGDTLWTRTFGGNNWDEGTWVEQTTDGGYIITGEYQNDNDVRHVCLIKTDANGLITFTSEVPYINPNRKLVKIVDLSGREISQPQKYQPYIEVYDDGTSQKKMKLK